MATELTIERDDAHPCAHGELWLARDGWWYCASCSPPVFPFEVLDRRQQLEVMRLFDSDAA